MKNEDDSVNAIIEETQDALLLAVDSPLDDWVLDSRVLFHTTPHRKIIQNFFAGDLDKVYLADWMLWVWETCGYCCLMDLFGYWRRFDIFLT